MTNSQIANEEQSPVETPSLRVVAEAKDGGNSLAKARGTFVKAGGAEDQALGSKLHLEAGVAPSREDECISTSCRSSTPTILGFGEWQDGRLHEGKKGEFIFKALRRALIKPGQKFRW